MVYVGVLGDNVELQKLFKIKRYPFFGHIYNNNNDDNNMIFYSLPDILTQQSILSFIYKI